MYNNPNVECAIERAAAWDEAPAVVITRSNGSEQLYNLRAMAEETPGRVDKELFRLLGATNGGGTSGTIARDVSYGSGTTSVKARRERRVAERVEIAADAELNAAGRAGTGGSAAESSSAAAAAVLSRPTAATAATATTTATTVMRTTGGKIAEKNMQRVELK